MGKKSKKIALVPTTFNLALLCEVCRETLKVVIFRGGDISVAARELSPAQSPAQNNLD